MSAHRALTKPQRIVLGAAFVIMAGVGGVGGYGTFSNIRAAYGAGTALGAVAAGEGATAVLGLVLLGLTMLGQSSPRAVRLGLWALPAAASVMAAMAGPDAGRTVIYAVTPMGMCVSAEGMAFLARRIVVHTDGRDAEAEARAASVVRQLAYHRAVAANHPSDRVKKWSERKSWRLARRVGTDDHTLGSRLLDVQRERVTAGADAALAGMFTAPTDTPALPPATPTEPSAFPSIEPATTVGTIAEESTSIWMERSRADLRESTPPTITLTRLPVPDPVPANAGKSILPLKPTPALAAPTGRTATVRPVARPVAAESARPVRTTYRVPQTAKAPRVRRTPEQLLTEARTATADWPDRLVTAEGIRRAVHTSPANARKLRDALLTERAA
ncbi:conjugal transfer protein [Streptomyces sp. J2-1]|uniref:conjugal transfer protein n=1 Tax=Streptomyces corallincola TaxID=2851888 RepID=UPI001C386B1A|nr:conjugal transfer protein [Streptomyces corallincola]MBV2358116.1 conjugal transfer protein [Streptomyces corallincola]